MERVTYIEFTRKAGESFFILAGIIIFSIYKLFIGGLDYEYILIGVIAFIGIVAVVRLGVIAKEALRSEDFQISYIDFDITGNVVILGLGLLSFYIFFVKGLYGIYLLFDSFSWALLFFRFVIIVLSFRLVHAVDKIQTVYKSIETKNYKK